MAELSSRIGGVRQRPLARSFRRACTLEARAAVVGGAPLRRKLRFPLVFLLGDDARRITRFAYEKEAALPGGAYACSRIIASRICAAMMPWRRMSAAVEDSSSSLAPKNGGPCLCGWKAPSGVTSGSGGAIH